MSNKTLRDALRSYQSSYRAQTGQHRKNSSAAESLAFERTIKKFASNKIEESKTLREEIAIAAMQGMLTNGEYWGREKDGGLCMPLITLVATSFEFADEFMKQREQSDANDNT